MHKVFFIGVVSSLLIYTGDINAQSVYQYKKDPGIGIYFSLYDFNSAATLRQSGLSQTIKSGSFTNIGDMQPGLSISYQSGLTNHLDYAVRYTGSFQDYPFLNSSGYGQQYLFSALDASIQYKFFSDRYWATPFLSGGIGTFDYRGNFGAYMPLGLGVQVNFFDEAFIFVHLQYQVGVSENSVPTFFYSLGVVGSIGNPKKK